MRVPFVIQQLWIAVSTPFRRNHTANICKHQTKQKGFMHDGQSTTIMQMPLAENGHPDYCLECIGKMSIRCAWCGKPIAIGSPVTLYIPNDDFKVPDYAVCYSEGDSKALVGCLRWNCADTGADMSGHWIPPGKVHRLMSPIELCLQSGQAVIVGDTHNYPASVSLHPIP